MCHLAVGNHLVHGLCAACVEEFATDLVVWIVVPVGPDEAVAVLHTKTQILLLGHLRACAVD